MSIHAQVVEIYKNGQLMQTYNNTSTSQYEVVFKPSGGQGEINGHAYVEIGGRKWATMNVGPRPWLGLLRRLMVIIILGVS